MLLHALLVVQEDILIKPKLNASIAVAAMIKKHMYPLNLQHLINVFIIAKMMILPI